MFNILLTADTCINKHFFKFNLRFNKFTTQIAIISATWINLLNSSIKSNSLTPILPFNLNRFPNFIIPTTSLIPTHTYLAYFIINISLNLTHTSLISQQSAEYITLTKQKFHTAPLPFGLFRIIQLHKKFKICE